MPRQRHPEVDVGWPDGIEYNGAVGTSRQTNHSLVSGVGHGNWWTSELIAMSEVVLVSRVDQTMLQLNGTTTAAPIRQSNDQENCLCVFREQHGCVLYSSSLSS